MKTILSLGVVALALGAPALASAACQRPAAPAVPNGEVATDAEMSSAIKQMEAFQSQMNAYLECLTQEHDAAYAWGEDKLADWNAAVRAFHARQ